ncbi:hypothetical protein CPB83DRAFT_888224 [Crepidotus variabilis]|uniref:Anti-proliferative protein domain-containing protein n=1 Tax=Crepidotus variabilis TaxID=179855 RepID=A0A9P6JWV2_9AGAR|nr:hypothetical protein CPB83DRAFT_888224 [Crepidotus variabilis]
MKLESQQDPVFLIFFIFSLDCLGLTPLSATFFLSRIAPPATPNKSHILASFSLLPLISYKSPDDTHRSLLLPPFTSIHAMASTSLSTAVAHAIRFLTAKLIGKYPQSTVQRLQASLHESLTAHYAPSWNPADPVRGSGRRCMTLSPSSLAPAPVWTACTAASVQWFDWIAIIGNKEFDLFVDPGCVAVRADNQIITIWSDESLLGAVPKVSSKTFVQQIVEADREEDDELFNLLNDEIAAPTWTTPIHPQFPVSTRSASPLSCVSEHSRCSSRSSNTSSSGFSHYSGDTASSRTSATSGSPSGSPTGQFKQSRRERARQARVYIDTNKKEVTPYDGGKTTVLTGGVMLGGAPKASAGKPKNLAVPSNAMNNSNSWRSVRA